MNPFNVGFRTTSATGGMGGDWGRSLGDNTTLSGADTASVDRERDRERDLRCGRTLGTCRNCVLVLPAIIAQDDRGEWRWGGEIGRAGVVGGNEDIVFSIVMVMVATEFGRPLELTGAVWIHYLTTVPCRQAKNGTMSARRTWADRARRNSRETASQLRASHREVDHLRMCSRLPTAQARPASQSPKASKR